MTGVINDAIPIEEKATPNDKVDTSTQKFKVSQNLSNLYISFNLLMQIYCQEKNILKVTT